ncbi:hypothetical protein [Halopseudomonas salegens]|uniref:Uncharacterized protein n=1 Tax=Halopseudomonas salegens TaxID=1434072 RepID=A0A1H2GYZ7_9GAMM|nr:hypothetical protein [Halopseudomonas salegens]SDU24751.1 hypothetical protein SAMN05216210_2648 [Halopseudomonas salegens]
MTAFSLAKEVMQQALAQGQQQGFDEQAIARALLAEVITVYKRSRSQADIRHELEFLADNLDDDADYTFMRP